MKKDKENPEKELIEKISSEAQKKIESKKRGKEIISGFGVFGIVGFSIAIPTILGIYLGQYLDDKVDSDISFTLTFLFLGLVIGCSNAWRWVKENSKGKN